MSDSLEGNRKRKRSESAEPRSPQLEQHSEAVAAASPRLQQESSALQQQSPLLPAAEFKIRSPRQESPLVEREDIGGVALTEDNLWHHEATMGPSTPTAGKVTANSIPDNSHQIKRLLRTYGIVVQAPITNPRLDALKAMANKVFFAHRHSAMKKNEFDEIRRLISKHEDDTEAAFFYYVWHAIMKETRTVFNEKTQTYEEKTFDADGISGTLDADFHTNALVELQDFTDEDRALLAAFSKLMAPKPDLAYGFDNDSFSPGEDRIIQAFSDYFMVCPRRVGTFLVIECKGSHKTIRLAQLQAARSTTALVRANRQLNEHAGYKEADHTGERDRTCVVSLCLDPRGAIMSIHWAEETPELGMQYHSHLLKEYKFSIDDDIRDLRRDVNNVLDWGEMTRRKHVNELVQALKGKPPLKSLKSVAQAASSSSKKRKGSSGAATTVEQSDDGAAAT